jgi:D-alanine-D-alanine ligase
MRASVAILHDASAAEGAPDSSDTLLEAAAIAAALVELGYEPVTVPVGLDLGALDKLLRAHPPAVVFNLVESLAGRGELIGAVPALLESLGVAFTGCSAQSLGVTSHKLLAKRWLLQAGLPAPAPYSADTASDTDRWIVKSVFEHASLGIDDSSVVTAAAVPDTLAAREREFGGRWLAERYVPGRELNVALIAAPDGPRLLPVAEIRFESFPAGKPAIVGYAAKWHANSFEYRHTMRCFDVERVLAERAAELARACWDLFALDGYARVDLRIDESGRPWVLEINANPCLSPDAGFAAALAEAGIAYGAAIGWLVSDALRRVTRPPLDAIR